MLEKNVIVKILIDLITPCHIDTLQCQKAVLHYFMTWLKSHSMKADPRVSKNTDFILKYLKFQQKMKGQRA